MEKLQHQVSLKLMRLLSAMLATGCFAAGWYLYYGKHIASPFYRYGNYLILVLYIICFITFGRIYDAFEISLSRISELAYSQSLAALAADGVMFIVFWLLIKEVPNVVPVLIVFAAQCLLAIAWAYGTHRWYFKSFPPKVTAIVYDNKIGIQELIQEYGLDKKYNVKMIISAEDCIADLESLESFETVFISGVHSHERNVVLKYCIARGIEVMVIPRIGDVLMSGAKAIHMFHLPMLRVQRYDASPEHLFVKRVMDIVISAIAIVFFSPLMLVVAIAIKAYDHGPVIYSQVRLTKNAKYFKMYKFRSMRTDAEKDGVARLSTGDNDDRITPIGRIIRKCRIDELPQLFNILVGKYEIIRTTKKTLINTGFSVA